MNLCKQDRLDAWGNLRVAFTWELLTQKPFWREKELNVAKPYSKCVYFLCMGEAYLHHIC